MNEDRLAELKEKYKGRSLKNELVWGMYANHSGYVSKATGEFVNWLCYKAYEALYEKANGEPQVEWIDYRAIVFCKECKHNYNKVLNHGKMKPRCDFTDRVLTENDFCSRGEREGE